MSVAELPDAVRQFCRPEARAEIEALAAEFEALKPRIDALMERAAEAHSAIELALLGRVELWDDATEDEFARSSGQRRLYNALADIHEATHDVELHSDELIDELDRSSWERRVACHGDTIACFESEACSHGWEYDPKMVRLIELARRGHLDEIVRRYPRD